MAHSFAPEKAQEQLHGERDDDVRTRRVGWPERVHEGFRRREEGCTRGCRRGVKKGARGSADDVKKGARGGADGLKKGARGGTDTRGYVARRCAASG